MKLQFWFEFASSYSYLAASRIAAISEAAKTPVVWEPFLLGPIFAQQGLDDSPFNIYPEKGRYMWRDMGMTPRGTYEFVIIDPLPASYYFSTYLRGFETGLPGEYCIAIERLLRDPR